MRCCPSAQPPGWVGGVGMRGGPVAGQQLHAPHAELVCHRAGCEAGPAALRPPAACPSSSRTAARRTLEHCQMCGPSSAPPPPAQACLCVLRSSLIVHRVGAAVAVFPGVLAAPLVLGTLSGSGGKVISDAIQAALGEAKGAPIWGLRCFKLDCYCSVGRQGHHRRDTGCAGRGQGCVQLPGTPCVSASIHLWLAAGQLGRALSSPTASCNKGKDSRSFSPADVLCCTRCLAQPPQSSPSRAGPFGAPFWRRWAPTCWSMPPSC